MLKSKKWSLIPALLLASFCCDAQEQTSYNFQQDDTLLRKKYFDESVKKKQLLIASIGKENASDYKNIYDQQFKGIDGIWKSSRPVTSPQAHNYLQSIVQKIIATNPELKDSDARVVFSRDWWPNAVSMGDGTIAINAGLVMYMSNEAELVFVICHELAHYYLNHTPQAIKKYVETVNSDAFQAELKRLSKAEYGVNKKLEELTKTTAFNSRKHSRDSEAAADKQALLFMKNTGYDCRAIISCLSLLDKVDDTLLYNSIKLEEAFNFTEYPFKKKWIQQESSIFSQMSQDDSPLTRKEKDSLKTHPDCSKRITQLADAINATTGGRQFIINENLFKQLKKEFFAEITEECFRSEKLTRNLYYSLQMLQANENRQLAIYSVARCLNLLYEKQLAHKIGTVTEAENKDFPQDYNLLIRMLSRLRLEELAGISYYFCNQYYTEMKNYRGYEKEMNLAKKLKNQ